MTPDQTKGVLSWLDGAEDPWTNNEGVTILKLIMPEPLLEALKAHLSQLWLDEVAPPVGNLYGPKELEADRRQAEANHFRAAITDIAEQPCRKLLLYELKTCSDELPDREKWCMPCRARQALAEW